MTTNELFLLKIAGSLLCLGFLYGIIGLTVESTVGVSMPIWPLAGFMLSGVACAALWGLQLFWLMPDR